MFTLDLARKSIVSSVGPMARIQLRRPETHLALSA